MNRRDSMWRTRYVPRFEILPVLAAGLVLDVAGHHFQTAVSLPVPIWLYSVGTALVAILLGPWWAATSALLTNSLIGQFDLIFFKYGAVDVLRAVAWGYFPRFLGLDRTRLLNWTHDRSKVLARLLLVVAGVTIVTAVLGTAVKTYIAHHTAGGTLSIRPSAAALYSWPASPTGESWLHDIPAYATGEFLRYGVDTLATAALLLGLIAACRPLTIADRRVRNVHEFLVSRGSVSLFLAVATSYALLLYLRVHRLPDPVITNPHIVVFLVSLLLSPVFLALLVSRYGVFCDADGSSTRVAEQRASRERHYRAVEQLRRERPPTLQARLLGQYGEVEGFVGILTLLLGWRGLIDSGFLADLLKSEVGATVGYLAIFGLFLVYYFAERRRFASRFASGTELIDRLEATVPPSQPEEIRPLVADVLAFATDGRFAHPITETSVRSNGDIIIAVSEADVANSAATIAAAPVMVRICSSDDPQEENGELRTIPLRRPGGAAQDDCKERGRGCLAMSDLKEMVYRGIAGAAPLTPLARARLQRELDGLSS